VKHIGNYEILSHVKMPECSIRIIGMKESEQVALHYHEKSTQIYTVLEQEVEVQVAGRTMRLRPYETVRIEMGVHHSVRPLEGPALVLSLSIPPLDKDDQHPAEEEARSQA
jgi:mannose-6-phosphate isomerase-like protein (cupin superfamily)